MHPNVRKKMLASVICNGAIFLLTIIATIERYAMYGSSVFDYFTEDSNLLCGLAGLAACIDGIAALKQNRDLRQWVTILKFAGTVGLAITFLVVLCFLGPTIGYGEMFIGGSIYFHGLGPVAAMISFIHLDRYGKLPGYVIFFGMLPVSVYGFIYSYNVLVSEAWSDFYGFTSFLPWYAACFAMAAAAGLCSIVIRLLHNKAAAVQ